MVRVAQLRRTLFALTATCVLCAAGCGPPPDVDIEETPIKVGEEIVGAGPRADDGETCVVDYEIYLPNGELVLAHDDFSFILGAGKVIRGIEQAVVGMRTGGKRVFKCPPSRHWGRLGYGPIPPNTDITISVTLKSVG